MRYNSLERPTMRGRWVTTHMLESDGHGVFRRPAHHRQDTDVFAKTGAGHPYPIAFATTNQGISSSTATAQDRVGAVAHPRPNCQHSKQTSGKRVGFELAPEIIHQWAGIIFQNTFLFELHPRRLQKAAEHIKIAYTQDKLRCTTITVAIEYL